MDYYLAPSQSTPAPKGRKRRLTSRSHGACRERLPAGSVESSSVALNLSLLQSGDFVAILPLSIARQHAMRGTMRVLPLPPIERLSEVVTYWRADATLPAIRLFSECLREASSDLSRG